MSEEIKEIWIQATGEKEIEEYSEPVRKLYDCITNLQKNYDRIYTENCKLREKHNITDISLLDENYKIQQENERLKEKVDKQYNAIVEKDNMLSNRYGVIEHLSIENKSLKTTIKDLKETGSIIRDFQDFQDYKSRIDKVTNEINRIIEIIQEQPSKDKKDALWILDRLDGLLRIVGGDKE